VLLLCLTCLHGAVVHNERVAGNSYTKYFGILLQSYAQKIMKIRLQSGQKSKLLCIAGYNFVNQEELESFGYVFLSQTMLHTVA